jgi:hypothetical protein
MLFLVIGVFVAVGFFVLFKLLDNNPSRFNKHAEVSLQLSDAIIHIIKPPFVFTKYFDADINLLSLPSALWSDPYIVGFIHETITATLNMDFPHISTIDKDEIIDSCLMNLSNGRLGQMLQRYPYGVSENELLLAGEYDAKVAHAILVNDLGKHYSEPDLKKAYSLDNYCSDSTLVAAHSLSRNNGYPVLACFWQLTIHDYIKKTILTDEVPQPEELKCNVG